MNRMLGAAGDNPTSLWAGLVALGTAAATTFAGIQTRRARHRSEKLEERSIARREFDSVVGTMDEHLQWQKEEIRALREELRVLRAELVDLHAHHERCEYDRKKLSARVRDLDGRLDP